MTRQGDLLFDPFGGLFERQRNVAPQVGTTALSGARGSPTSTKKVFEYRPAEDVTKVLEDIVYIVELRVTAIHACMPVLIVSGSFVFVVQDFVGLGGFLELGDRVFIIAVAIWMIFDCEFAIRPRQFVLRARAAYAKHFIIVSFGCCHCIARDEVIESFKNYTGLKKGHSHREWPF